MANGGRERIVAANPIAIAGGRVIASPFQFYLDGADNIRLEGWNTCVGAVLQVQGRAIDNEGNTQAFNMVLPLTADRLVTREDFSPVRGYILNLVAVVIEATPCIGQTFARVSIIRGFTGATIVLGVLLQGYVTSQQGLGWPGSPIELSVDGGGYVRQVVGTTPAAGAQISETVPAGARWQILRLYSFLITDATAGNRFPRLDFFQAGLGTFRGMQPTPQGPSVTANYTWAPNLPIAADVANGVYMQPIPDEGVLLEGDVLSTAVSGMAAGDQWGQPQMYLREWMQIE